MKASDWKIGDRFKTPGGLFYVVTDVGSRVVVAVSAEHPDWMRGPPYALAEYVFDEDDIPDLVRVEGGAA